MRAGRKSKSFAYDHERMQTFGEHCSATERRADDATRDAIDWLKCEFMLDKVGETYDGIITATTSFGIFVELQDIYVEGLVHVTALGNDYYHYDPLRHWLIGERTNRIFRLGDPVRVKVVQVNLDDRKIDFELNEKSSRKATQKKPQKDKDKGKGKGREKTTHKGEAATTGKKQDKGSRGSRRKSKGKLARKSKAKTETRRTRSPRRRSR